MLTFAHEDSAQTETQSTVTAKFVKASWIYSLENTTVTSWPLTCLQTNSEITKWRSRPNYKEGRWRRMLTCQQVCQLFKPYFSFCLRLDCPPFSSHHHSSPLGSLQAHDLWSPIEWQPLDLNTQGQLCWRHTQTDSLMTWRGKFIRTSRKVSYMCFCASRDSKSCNRCLCVCDR